MRDLPLILFGVGGVGRALLRQIVEQRTFHALQYGLRLELLAICDSDGALVEPNDGVDDNLVQEIIAAKAAGQRLAQHPAGGIQNDLSGIVDIAGRSGTVVVDCTATEATVPALLFARDQHYKIVLANKKPLTIDQEVYYRLTSAGGTNGNRLGGGNRLSGDSEGSAPVRQFSHTRWETTVGAALPVIATLNRLLSSGDDIKRITGTFSGTLGYVMTGLQEGKPFSAIVAEAHQLGYTEPDPRDDLGGVDVARKALILARGLGWELDLDDVEVQGLYPADMDGLTVAEFMQALPRLDEQFQMRISEATAAGQVLRFAAQVEDGTCRVGPTLVSAASPLGRLSGTDNLVEFTSRWYTPNPLVIQGRGAGTDVTAAGVLSDIIELAYTA